MSQENESFTKLFIKSGSIIFVSLIITRFFGYLFNSFLTKSISSAEFGSYTFAWSTAMLANAVLLLGISQASARYIAFYRGKNDFQTVDSLVKTGLVLVMALSSFSLVLIIGINRFNPSLLSLDRALILFIAGVFIIHSIGFFFANVISGYRKPEFGGIFSMIFSVLSFVFVLITVKYAHSFNMVLLAIILAFLIPNIWGFVYVVQNYGLRGNFSPALVRQLIIFGIPVTFIETANGLLAWANLFIIKMFYTFSEVGLFSVASITSNIILIFTQPLLNIFAPIVAELCGKKDHEKLGFMSSYLFERFLIVSSPALLVLLLFPEGILKIIFTEDYSKVSFPLQILSLSVFMLGLSMLFRLIITASGKPQLEARIIIIAAIINVILNLILVKPLGIIGASMANLLSSIIILCCSFVYVRNLTRLIVYRNRLWKIAASLLISLALIFLVKIAVPNLILAFFISFIILGVSYTGSLFLLKTFREEDSMILKNILERTNISERKVSSLLFVFRKGVS